MTRSTISPKPTKEDLVNALPGDEPREHRAQISYDPLEVMYGEFMNPISNL